MKKIRVCCFFMSAILVSICCFGCRNEDASSCGSQQSDIQECTQGDEESTSAVEETIAENNETIDTYDYDIKELDVTLVIPESLYVYQIDGIYLDWTGGLNVHSLSQWTLVTDKEYDEAVLAETLCENYQEEAPHIIFAVSITPDELFPARRLCHGLFSEISVRVSDDRYCEVLDTRNIVRTGGRFGDYVQIEQVENTEEWSEWIDRWTESIEEKTISTPHLYGALDAVLRPAGLEVGDENLHSMTLANEGLWEIYIEAIDQLQFSPEAYAYNETVVEMLIHETEEKAERMRGNNELPRTEELVSVYVDSRDDIYIRAYYYAKSVIGAKLSEGVLANTASLDDFVVVLQDWKNGQRSFITYRKDENGEYERYGGGYDYFDNLYDSYRYVQKHGMEPGPLEFTVNLTPYPDRFVVCVENGIRQENGEFILSGKKVYGGDIVIDHNKKALLDAGAKMIVCHEGEEMFTLSSVVMPEYGGVVAYYRDVDKYGYVMDQELDQVMDSVIISTFVDSRMDTVEPKTGDFQLKNVNSADYTLVLEEEFELAVPADTLIYPYNTYQWEHMNKYGLDSSIDWDAVEPITMAEYYELVVNPYLMRGDFLIYIENGEIVRIEEEFGF